MLFRVQGFGQNRARLQKLVSRDGTNMGSSLNFGPFGVLFIRMPYYIGDLKRDPTLENYPFPFSCTGIVGDCSKEYG